MIRLEASFDDGSEYDVRIADLLDRYNIKTTFFIPVNWQTHLLARGIKPLTDDQLDMIASRFEIGSHGMNHALLTKVDRATQDYEIVESKIELEQRFEREVDQFCYPAGYFSRAIKKKVKKAGYTSARTVKIDNLIPPTDAFELATTVHIGHDRKEYRSDWLSFAMRKVVEALALDKNGQEVIFHFWGHSEEINRYNQWRRVETFLEHIHEELPN